MKSTHKNSVWAGIWNQQQLWMLRIWRKDFCVTLQYSKSTLNQCPRQQFCFKPALTWSLSKRIKIPLSPPPTYFQQAFHCVYEQGSSLPVFPHCTIGFPRASLAAPALLESRVYSSPPLSASRWGGGLWWGLDATECQCQKWPFSWKSGAGVRHCPCKKGETLLFYFFPLPFWEIIFELMTFGSLGPRKCQIFPQDWFLHLLPHLHCCTISSSSRPISHYRLISAFLRFHG